MTIMKEELQNKLVEILTSIQSAAGKASDFAMEQLPDIAQSYVAYGRASLTLAVAIGLLLVVLAWRLVKRGVSDDVYMPEPSIIGGALSGAASLVFLLVNTPPMLLVWFAPKVWLLKEIAGMLK